MDERTGDETDRMRVRARDRFAAGEVVPEVAVGHGGRWGISAIFRLPGQVRHDVAGLARQVGAVAGPGHWIHDADSLHLTICTFEPHRPGVSPTDRRVRMFGAALRAAATGLPAVRLVLRGVGPHPRGVAVLAHPEDDTADTLRRRIDSSLRAGSGSDRPGPSVSRLARDWYVNLVHFAAPAIDVGAVLTWCDDQGEAELGSVVLPAAELVRWDAKGGTVRPVPLDRVELTGG
ncbi:hypothetical protein FHR37_005396 [Actinopolymorpha cephalotaxi]|uniref:2'-5' RNA ligase superfamily protein n=1 Tax=Actinopolymorpha cephalotaxi TaxID=504797 RepID=A0ABX2SA77_9ACTN|nr:hypothetical protein [Actinopolymorpha cephalotaxi]